MHSRKSPCGALGSETAATVQDPLHFLLWLLMPTSCGVIAQGQLPYHTLKIGLLTDIQFDAGTSAAHSQAIDPFITSWPLLGVAEDA